MSTGTETTQNGPHRLDQRLDEVAALCAGGVAPAAFHEGLLSRLLESLSAPAGAVWLVGSAGQLVLEAGANFLLTGAAATDDARLGHEALLRQALSEGRPLFVPPHGACGEAGEGPAPANHTPFLLLLAPIRQGEQVVGLLEVFQGADQPIAVVPGLLRYVERMAELAGRYHAVRLAGPPAGESAVSRGWGDWVAQKRDFDANRARYPVERLRLYVGQVVAWGPDGSAIRAAGPDLGTVWARIREEGEDPSRFTYEDLPPV